MDWTAVLAPVRGSGVLLHWCRMVKHLNCASGPCQQDVFGTIYRTNSSSELLPTHLAGDVRAVRYLLLSGFDPRETNRMGLLDGEGEDGFGM